MNFIPLDLILMPAILCAVVAMYIKTPETPKFLLSKGFMCSLFYPAIVFRSDTWFINHCLYGFITIMGILMMAHGLWKKFNR